MIIYWALVVRERGLSTIKGMMAPNLRYHKWCLRHCANYVSSGHTSGAPSQHGQYRHLAEKEGVWMGTTQIRFHNPTKVSQGTWRGWPKSRGASTSPPPIQILGQNRSCVHAISSIGRPSTNGCTKAREWHCLACGTTTVIVSQVQVVVQVL